MPWIEETIMSQKMAFIERALEKDRSFTQLCIDFNVSRKTGYQILSLYKEKGPSGLKLGSRAPLYSPNKTPKLIEEKVIEIRIKYPTWGPRKIERILQKNGIEKIPSISTILAILKRNGYITLEESLKRKKLCRFEREFSNELWQMDFKGNFQLETKESCYPLTIVDDYSRFSPCVRSCANERFLTVFEQLSQVFHGYGLPDQINVDNGNPWGNSRLFKHTKLTIWLMRLGIKVTHSRPFHPQTNGKVERFHRTLKKDVLSRNSIKNFKHAQILFDEWREIYNTKRPHEGIGMLIPADRYKPSQKVMPKKLLSIEYEHGAILRKVRGNGYIFYDKKEYHMGEGFTGFNVEIRPHEGSGIFDIYFGPNKIYTYNLE